MTPERLFDLAAEFAEAAGNAGLFHARAAATTGDEHTTHTANAARWEAIVARRREHLRTTLREALRGTVTAIPDDRLPVATWQRGRVEIRATTTASGGARAVRVRYTPAQAVAAGAALIACAAITDKQTGGSLAGILAAFPPNPTPHDEPGNNPTETRS